MSTLSNEVIDQVLDAVETDISAQEALAWAGYAETTMVVPDDAGSSGATAIGIPPPNCGVPPGLEGAAWALRMIARRLEAKRGVA
jgi:hypothetical protein